MIILLTIGGTAYPLAQVTVRRDAEGGEISGQIAGYAMLTAGQECRLSVDDLPDIVGTLTGATLGEQTTQISATLPVTTGAGIWLPERVMVRSTGMLRADPDFQVLPGDTLHGIAIESVTHTVSARGSGFTEARW
jgi:hypothetical protein